ncbi:SusD/RagB family nutrient-binding outer membrane lipoprotein [Chitinophaga nivalis]|uniref:SusD/RagB family nutrient-binding outer membrane lipoprotein n=1 Tax=Chitinophaga nivalis TaxID=2991709 RepID=A0ABT3IN74_9BACT|nr:SusD/RagB family nutrient-binding outer membrane lipoprotein [Chitinophaga nivalis]MCW3464875.1 SusD/RagB family nutrient-binding outer membrane lipoprotein [Chitinophaga nivalis]MCW3485434.1 SusD/RagB family nutrient-binding outer membrane lipoprotein [Chitinophaga nivalis]
MRKRNIAIILLSALALGSGCKKFLDVNDDPNNPLEVSEKLILPPVEVTIGTQVVGGFNGSSAAYWMQQLSQNQPAPDMESYRILSSDVDNTWTFYIYPNILANLQKMINQATAAKHYEYAAIGKTLYAFNLAIATDIWNNVPYTDALKVPAIMRPKYDSQESVYINLQGMLDSALYFASQPASKIAPGGDDYIYQGDMDKWKKFIYMLKARFYLRLTKAPGRTAALQADSALTALAKGFVGNEDNAVMPYPGTAQAESPWYQNTLPGAGGVVMSKTFIDFLKNNNDPRLPVIATKDASGGYSGRVPGANTIPNPNVLSKLNTFYGGAASPLFLATYSEALFIKAEATLIKQGVPAAVPVFAAAVNSHMSLLKVDGTAAAAYIAARVPMTAANALEQIIYEKYVAGFLSIETYNDWRRTGYPKLQLVQNAYVNYIPRRWPYPSNEILANPQPGQNASTADRVWWDTK